MLFLPARRRSAVTRAVELLGTERLGHVVVGAELQPRYAVGFLAPCREHDDGDRRHGRIVPHRLADEQAIHARQHQIQNHQIGRGLAKSGEHVRAGGDPLDAVARFLQIVGDERRDVGVVFDHQDVRHEERLNAD